MSSKDEASQAQDLEESLLIREAQKNPEVFGRLYDKYYRPIFGFIYKRTNNYELALDLTSETFFQALKNLWRYKYTGKSFSAWLYKIAIAQVSDFYRQKRKYCEITLENAPEIIANPSFSPDTLYKEEEKKNELEILASKVHSLLSHLDENQHTVIVLKYYEKKTIKEISEIMDIPEGTVKSHIHRGLKKMQKLLEKNNIKQEYDIQPKEKTEYRKALESSKVS